MIDIEDNLLHRFEAKKMSQQIAFKHVASPKFADQI